PLVHRPSLLPALHFEHCVGGRAPAVRRGARPCPLLWLLHHACTHRIQFDVTQSLPQVLLVRKSRKSGTDGTEPISYLRSVPSFPDHPPNVEPRRPVQSPTATRRPRFSRSLACPARDL